MDRKVLAVDNRNLHLILNKSVKEWESQYGGDYNLWDVPLEELLDGTLEINDTIWYYYIDGRCYETTEYVEDMGRGLSEETKSLIETAHKTLCSAHSRSKLDGCPTIAVDNLSRLCDEISNLY